MEKETQTRFMHQPRFGEGKRLANKTSQPLSQRIIPALYMRGCSCFLSCRCMLLFRNHCLIGLPKVAVAMSFPIGWWNGFPQGAAGLFTAISYGIGHHLSCLSTQRDPDPGLLGLASAQRTTVHLIPGSLPLHQWHRAPPAFRSRLAACLLFFIQEITEPLETPKVRSMPLKLLRS